MEATGIGGAGEEKTSYPPSNSKGMATSVNIPKLLNSTKAHMMVIPWHQAVEACTQFIVQQRNCSNSQVLLSPGLHCDLQRGRGEGTSRYHVQEWAGRWNGEIETG